MADNSDRRYKIYPPHMVASIEIVILANKLQTDLQKEWMGPSISCRPERVLCYVATPR